MDHDLDILDRILFHDAVGNQTERIPVIVQLLSGERAKVEIKYQDEPTAF